MKKRKRSTNQQQEEPSSQRDEAHSLLLDRATNPNFEQLAKSYPEFAREWNKLQQRKNKPLAMSPQSLSTLSTPSFNIALTRALIHMHFGLVLPNLPITRLCPPIPNRFFYVQWIQSHLLPLLENEEYFVVPPSSTSDTVTSVNQDQPQYHQRYGCDIGTGASCVYPLLFQANLLIQRGNTGTASQHENNSAVVNSSWTIVATDIDEISVGAARGNVTANRFNNFIQVLKVDATLAQLDQLSHQENVVDHPRSPNSQLNGSGGGPICRAFQACAQMQQAPSLYFDFVMTNPPFYDDAVSTERTDPRFGDARERTPMTCNEGSYPGGEVGFVLDMIRDSLQYSDRLGWCSCMCGKKSTFTKLKGLLTHLLGPAHVVSTEFGPGTMTRWFLAWTLRRPQMRSPLALTIAQRRINVENTSATTGMDAISEVMDRIRSYVASIKDWRLSFHVDEDVTTNETTSRGRVVEGPNNNKTDSRDINAIEFPERIANGLSKTWKPMDVLPREGHFCVDVTVSTADRLSDKAISVIILLDCYRHSSLGEKAIERIVNQMEGEVCRSNRRWRRLLKRTKAE